jgi:hypothetical protein
LGGGGHNGGYGGGQSFDDVRQHNNTVIDFEFKKIIVTDILTLYIEYN